jgi:uncharacterized membrane protein
MSAATTTVNPRVHGKASVFDRLACFFCRHWLVFVCFVLGLYVGLPFLAPVLMQVGWKGAANVIYAVYSTQCHQMPQRSFFLFGPKLMYSLVEIQAAWQNTNNPLVLRQFVGNAQMGWKVAWSDRMVSLYGGLWLFAVLWSPLRRRVKPLPWWGLVLLALPMVLDGGTHLVSDFAGIGQGFRDSNAWLAALTGHMLPAAFYAGDAVGSFNSWMRIATGLLFGLSVVWFAFPNLQRMFVEMEYNLETKVNQASLSL